MDWQPPERPSGPWYRNWEYWTERGMRYIRAMRGLGPDSPAFAEIRQMSRFSLGEMVFESNAIERAGLPRGETRRVVEEYFPRLPESQDLARASGDLLRSLQEADWSHIEAQAERHGIDLGQLSRTVRMGGRSRGYQEVVRHVAALHDAQRRGGSWLLVAAAGRLRTSQGGTADDSVVGVALQSWRVLGELGDDPFASPPRLLAEGWLKECHRTLAEGLLGADAGVPAGEYRKDSRAVDGHVFPVPELIAPCMARFLNDVATISFEDVWEHLFRTAALTSYEFVRIHPFPDFNGRMSRIILAVVFAAALLPFCLTLRGDATGRKRYYRSLRSANAGDMKPYEALIAMRTVEMFEDIDRNLAAAGLPSLLTFAPDA